MHSNFIRLPPDSTGKRIAVISTWIVGVTNVNDFSIGDTVVGETSNARLEVLQTNSFAQHLYLQYDTRRREGAPLQIGENLLVNGVAVGSVTTDPYPIYTNSNIQVSYNNPHNGQIIDERGQAYFRFAEGSPTLDPFQRLRVGESTVIGTYDSVDGPQEERFTNVTTTGGSIEHNSTAVETTLRVNSASTATVSRTTNRYHHYQPGVGTSVMLTLAQSDQGKLNNVRRWGFFDEQDGIFFELNGTDFDLVIRSSTTGSVVEQRIPRQDWNGDKLDGTGLSGMVIDLTKANLFFIDFAWLGVGTVRMGVMAPDGSRWTSHSFENPNNNFGAFMRSGTLPIRYENSNIGTTSGTTELRTICSAVYSESKIDYAFWRYADIGTPLKTVTSNTVLVALRPSLIFNGTTNRIGIYPSTLEVFVTGGPVQLSVIINGTVTDATWSLTGAQGAEGDIDGTTYTNGDVIKTEYVNEGAKSIQLEKYFPTNDQGLHVLADASGAQEMIIVATAMTATATDVAATIGYRELN